MVDGGIVVTTVEMNVYRVQVIITAQNVLMVVMAQTVNIPVIVGVYHVQVIITARNVLMVDMAQNVNIPVIVGVKAVCVIHWMENVHAKLDMQVVSVST